VQYVNTADGHRYILRIYNNGNKTEKVRSQWYLQLQAGVASHSNVVSVVAHGTAQHRHQRSLRPIAFTAAL
jgi:hypothetical protein